MRRGGKVPVPVAKVEFVSPVPMPNTGNHSAAANVMSSSNFNPNTRWSQQTTRSLPRGHISNPLFKFNALTISSNIRDKLTTTLNELENEENDFQVEVFLNSTYLEEKFLQIKISLEPQNDNTCPTKDRYPNIKRYSENFFLQTEEQSEEQEYVLKIRNKDTVNCDSYINASPLYFTTMPKQCYIATQGPINDTLGDFWQMVWEQDCKVIVMLTKLVENGTPKCERYFPEKEEEEVAFGEYVVKLTESEIQTHYVVRTIKVTKKGEERNITQFHFTSWPDHGVPDSIDPFAEFLDEVYEKQTPMVVKTPMVVHCSAGVGRTGVFIACYHAYSCLKAGTNNGFKSIANMVQYMRYFRPNMVQTPEQFEFIKTYINYINQLKTELQISKEKNDIPCLFLRKEKEGSEIITQEVIEKQKETNLTALEGLKKENPEFTLKALEGTEIKFCIYPCKKNPGYVVCSLIENYEISVQFNNGTFKTLFYYLNTEEISNFTEIATHVLEITLKYMFFTFQRDNYKILAPTENKPLLSSDGDFYVIRNSSLTKGMLSIFVYDDGESTYILEAPTQLEEILKSKNKEIIWGSGEEGEYETFTLTNCLNKVV